MVRFPLEKRWDEILEFFGNDERLTIIAGEIYSLAISIFDYLRLKTLNRTVSRQLKLLPRATCTKKRKVV